jgi:conjugal transfer mating pair stabilization protein TraN
MKTHLAIDKFLILAVLMTGLMSYQSFAGERFRSSYSCGDAVRICNSRGTRVVEGFEVHRDCWEYSYVKTCNYPSRNDCGQYSMCYAVADHECLLKDSLGYCVNLKREFSCKSHDFTNKENQTIRTDLVERDGPEGLICKGIPCIDGNCVDKSYQTNGEMMDSVSKLYATSKMNPDKAGTFNLFEGTKSNCSKKAAGYSNCCRIDPKGWGRDLGARCSADEKYLMEQQSKGLCVYVGKENKQTMGISFVVKHHFCCFSSLLDKVIQVGGRKQLGRNFGSAKNPDCRGFTLEEIQRINWEEIDFTEFIEDFKKKFYGKYKTPNTNEIAGRVNSSMGHLNKYDTKKSEEQNNKTGWNEQLRDDSWEAEEERRVEEERLAIERTRQAEEQRRQMAQEQERGKQRQEEEKKQKRMVKERELAQTRSDASLFNLVFYGKLKSLPYSSYRSGSYNYVRQIYRMRQEQEELITTLTKERNWDLQQILNSARFKELEALIVNYKNWVSGGKLGESVEVQQIHDNWRIHDDKADRLLKELANGNY